MSDKEPQHGDKRRITVDVEYVIGGWWRTGNGDLLQSSSPAIKSVELVPEPPYTPEVGDWFTDEWDVVWFCFTKGWAARAVRGCSAPIANLAQPFKKVGAL